MCKLATITIMPNNAPICMTQGRGSATKQINIHIQFRKQLLKMFQKLIVEFERIFFWIKCEKIW